MPLDLCFVHDTMGWPEEVEHVYLKKDKKHLSAIENLESMRQRNKKKTLSTE